VIRFYREVKKEMRCLALIITLLMVVSVFADEIEVQPGAEAKDAQITSAMSNYNWGDRLYLTDNWGNCDTRGMIEFDFEEYGFDPEGNYRVNEATFSVYHILNSPEGATWYLYRITEEWEEMTVTYNNKPDYDEDYFSETVYSASPSWEEFDVTNMVQSWLDGEYDNYGFYLWRGGYANKITYHISSDHGASSWHWKLYVNYDDLTVIEETSIGTVKALYR